MREIERWSRGRRTVVEIDRDEQSVRESVQKRSQLERDHAPFEMAKGVDYVAQRRRVQGEKGPSKSTRRRPLESVGASI
ncbi:hypothetical protein ACOSQ3_003249 [Xanthoceras sorbifolium]